MKLFLGVFVPGLKNYLSNERRLYIHLTSTQSLYIYLLYLATKQNCKIKKIQINREKACIKYKIIGTWMGTEILNGGEIIIQVKFCTIHLFRLLFSQTVLVF